MAPTAAGHRGGPPLAGETSIGALTDETERLLDCRGLARVHVAGNSLGGWMAIELARRGRAISVCALSHGKGNKERRIPFGRELLDVLEQYLSSRASRFPQQRKRSPSTDVFTSFSAKAPLFLGADGERIIRGTLQYRILRAFKKTGVNSERPSGALVHGLRHTFATELANANVSVYALMKLLGHESMITSQRYVDGAGADTRSATELNPLYGLISAGKHESEEPNSNATNDFRAR
ncbi:alpha/beta fold hydrolase [Mycobacterium sp. 1245852.3]|uniref:tyrosine-type recombinase/integrase n=1 Tax=Mycobacterium sp. 1245852.3 TaxID=1856860 RepID=UPI0009EF1EFB